MATRDVEELRSRIERFLKDSGLGFTIDGDRDFLVHVVGFEDEHVWCVPQAWDADGPHTIISVAAPTNVDLRIDDELKRHLTDLNGRQLFGKFILAEEQVRVLFVHQLLGDQLNRAELEGAIHAVAKSAHRHADEIAERWGGRRFGTAP
jgi:hypothetical protein